MGDIALDLARARFDAHGLTFADSRDDAGRFFGQCPTHRDRKLVLDFDPADDLMRLHSGDCGCLPGEVIRQLGLPQTVPHVHASIRTDRARRMLGVKTAFRDLAGVDDGYLRMTLALEAAGANGTRSDPGGVRGEGRYQCPACGAPGDGHGLRVRRRDDGGPRFHCYANDCPGDEILAALDLTWADIGWKPDPRVGEYVESLPGDARSGDTDPAVSDVKPVALTDALKVYRKWLHLDDDAPVLVVAATVVANNAEGDPLWVLLVGPPSSGKTEALQGIAGLAYVHGAATVTESALLSGVSKRDRDKDATGGLLRQIGEYGIILCKDFTSVLSQNKDNAAAALAALREIYDGSWDRPTGGGGGRVLSWRGKCGFVGGVTGSIDRFGQVIGALGDRFLLLRLPDVSPEDQAKSALAQVTGEKKMRAELAEAMTGLVAGADHAALTRDLTEAEAVRLVKLATFTARARTVVERNGYTNEVLVLPQAEGPARVVKQMRRLYSGLEAIGADESTRWAALRRVAVDCVPRARVRVMRVLMDAPAPVGTGDVARVIGVDWKTAFRHLSDCRLLDVAGMDVLETGGFGTDKAQYLWSASDWLRSHFPLEDKYPPSGRGYTQGEVDLKTESPYATPRTSPPKASPAPEPGGCCKGGPAVPACGLCAKSANYWKRDAADALP